MIPAKEARKQSKENSDNKLSNEISKIEARIKLAVAEGERGICVGQFLSLETKMFLEELGYTVKYGNQYNESYTTINW